MVTKPVLFKNVHDRTQSFGGKLYNFMYCGFIFPAYYLVSTFLLGLG